MLGGAGRGQVLMSSPRDRHRPVFFAERRLSGAGAPYSGMSRTRKEMALGVFVPSKRMM